MKGIKFIVGLHCKLLLALVVCGIFTQLFANKLVANTRVAQQGTLAYDSNATLQNSKAGLISPHAQLKLHGYNAVSFFVGSARQLCFLQIFESEEYQEEDELCLSKTKLSKNNSACVTLVRTWLTGTLPYTKSLLVNSAAASFATPLHVLLGVFRI